MDNQASEVKPLLIDRFGRVTDYIRISVTDRCDLRCVYCMSEDMTFVPRAKVLTLEEITTIARAFVELGVSKIRFTGGEPLIRSNITKLFSDVSQMEGLHEAVITTNGTQLERMAAEIKASGIKRINISLDTLKQDRFKNLTRHGDLAIVLRGIDQALKMGFDRIKLNSVILKNRNDDEIVDLVQFAIDRNIDITFIEEMPLGVIGDRDRAEAYYSSDKILSDLRHQYKITALNESTGGPSKYYNLDDTETRIGFISPHSHNFCHQCNRVRLTAEGRLLLCLGQEHSVDLRHVIRAYPGDQDRLKRTIIDSMEIKPEGHDFNLKEQPIILRHMNVTGG